MRIHMVSGPSCSGKSLYIKKHIKEGQSVIFPRTIDAIVPGAVGSWIFHYNLFRPFSQLRQMRRLHHLLKNPLLYLEMLSSVKNHRPFDREPGIQKLISLGKAVDSVVLVVPRSVLEQRMAQRTKQEILVSELKDNYNREKFIGMSRQIDLADLYKCWIEFLSRNRIDYILIDSLDDQYRKINSVNEMLEYINEYK